MKNLVAIVCVLCVVAAIPVPEGPKTSLDLLNIPLSNGKELDVLSITDGEGKITERNKRTIDILRQLFPTLTQLIEMKIQAVLPILIRTLGPVLLRGGLGGGSGGGASTTSSTDDFDDDDDDFGSDSGVSQNAGGRKAVNTEDGDNSVDANAINEELVQTIRRVREAAAAAEQQKVEEPEKKSNVEVKVELPGDQDPQPSEPETQQTSGQLDELTLDNDTDDENRNKRFLSFGFGGSSGNGAGGGSGNFLFDVIRKTADRAARAAGTVYRVVAGTETLDVNSQSSDSSPPTAASDSDKEGSEIHSLVAGSSGTQETDERANQADGTATVSGDGYTEGIPGPVTRLFVLANRGLSNLIQDLILRLAQTSERVVNFKARLITSLI